MTEGAFLTTVVAEPNWLHVERRTDVENVRVTALQQIGEAQLGAGGKQMSVLEPETENSATMVVYKIYPAG